MKKSLWVLLAAAFLLAALLWLKQHREAAPDREGFVFDARRGTDITSLRVQYLKDSMRLVRVDGRWLTAEDRYPVDTARIQKVLAWLMRTQTREKVSDAADAQSLWDYGLNPEDARTVEWTWSAGDTVRLLLGKTSALDYSFTYWKWKDAAKRAVYRTPGSLIWDLSPRASDWKTRALWEPFRAADVRALEVEWRDNAGALRHYRVERTRGTAGGADSFRLTEPLAAPASRSVAENLFEKATEFTADDFELERDPNPDRISADGPAVKVSIHLENGTIHTLKAGRMFGPYQYTQHPHHPNLVWVFRWRYDYFKKTPEELIRKEAT